MDEHLLHSVTVSLTVKVDMQDEMQNFVSQKSWPCLSVSLGDQTREHRFSQPDEEHTFTMTAQLRRKGEHDLLVQFTDRQGPQGAIEIISLQVQGSPAGLLIYKCRYTPYETGETLVSHLYLGWPGEWRLAMREPILDCGAEFQSLGHKSSFSKPHIRALWDQHANKLHLHDMVVSVSGEDASAMMMEMEPGDHTLMKYENNILNSEKALKGKRVLDIGCNHGLWSYMAARHGAKHVVGVEPRGMFINGLNRFANQHDLPMEFHRGYDTDLDRLVREHNIDTVLLLQVDEYLDWENTMYEIRRSGVEWVIMQMSTIPDTWVDLNSPVFNFAESGGGMPSGFTLHYEQHNASPRAGINPLYRDQADPETGFQHVATDGDFDIDHSRVFSRNKSRQYARKFIDHVGFSVERSAIQDTPAKDTKQPSWTNCLTQWYLLRNKK